MTTPASGRRRTRAVLADYARRGYRIVGTSTSCSHTFKAEYEEMLDLHDDDTKAVAEATWDICEFLLDLHEQGRLDTSFGALDADLPYHAPCQLRSHGIGLAGARAVRARPGPARRGHGPRLLRDRGDVRAQEGEVRHRDGRRRAAVREGRRRPARAAAACDSETCRWQIQSATGVPTRHPVEFLLDAYRAGRRGPADRDLTIEASRAGALRVVWSGAGAVGSFLAGRSPRRASTSRSLGRRPYAGPAAGTLKLHEPDGEPHACPGPAARDPADVAAPPTSRSSPSRRSTSRRALETTRALARRRGPHRPERRRRGGRRRRLDPLPRPAARRRRSRPRSSRPRTGPAAADRRHRRGGRPRRRRRRGRAARRRGWSPRGPRAASRRCCAVTRTR